MAPRKTQTTTRPVDPIVPADSGVETWRNTTAGVVFIVRVGEYGRRIEELVQGGRTFAVTPAERRMNQNLCATKDLDPFVNGTLAPVSLLEDEPDTEILRANPNNLEEADLPKLFRLPLAQFDDRIGKITNVNVIGRLLNLARAPEQRDQITLAKYEALKVRELTLKGELNDEPGSGQEPRSGQPRPVTPR